MMKKYFLAVLVLAALGVVPRLIQAADQPATPAGQPESTQVSEETKASIQQDIPRLKTQLDEYRKSHAPMQKLYLTMRALLIDYSLVGEARSPEALALGKEADYLQKTYPKVLNSGVVKDAPPPTKKKASVPKDAHVMGIWGSGHTVAVKYQYRVEFFKLPADVFFKQTEGDSFLVRRSNGAESRVNIGQLNLKPIVRRRLQRPVEIVPRWPRTVENHVLMCTSMLNGFAPVTDEERAQLPSGGSEYFDWTDKGGEAGDFCGVVALDGHVVWKLDYKQSVPDHLLFPVALSPDGNRALIYSGSRVGGDEGTDSVGQPRDLYLWEYPDKVKKLKASDYGTNYDELFDKFTRGKL